MERKKIYLVLSVLVFFVAFSIITPISNAMFYHVDYENNIITTGDVVWKVHKGFLSKFLNVEIKPYNDTCYVLNVTPQSWLIDLWNDRNEGLLTLLNKHGKRLQKLYQYAQNHGVNLLNVIRNMHNVPVKGQYGLYYQLLNPPLGFNKNNLILVCSADGKFQRGRFFAFGFGTTNITIENATFNITLDPATEYCLTDCEHEILITNKDSVSHEISINNITVENPEEMSNVEFYRRYTTTDTDVGIPYMENRTVYHENVEGSVCADNSTNCVNYNDTYCACEEPVIIGYNYTHTKTIDEPFTTYTVSPNETIMLVIKYNVLPNSNGKYNITFYFNDEYYNIDPWWNSSWAYKRQINITNQNTTEAMPSGQTVYIVLDTMGNKFRDDGQDVRIIYDDGITAYEIDRWNITPFNSSDTRIFFKTQAEIPAGGYDSNYYIYYGNLNADEPMNDASKIFLAYDTFDSGVNSSLWSSSFPWQTGGYVYGQYGVGSYTMITNYYWGNMTVVLYKFNVPSSVTDTPNPRHYPFAYLNDGNMQSRYSAQGDYICIHGSSPNVDCAYANINHDTWYWAKAVRGGWNVNNQMYLDWTLYVDNSTTALAGRMTNSRRGWDVSENTGHKLKVDDFYIYSYFYPEPNIIIEGEETFFITFTDSTLDNNTRVMQNWIFVNATASDNINSCTIQWNGVNESMTVNGDYCYINKTGLSVGQYCFIVYANDSYGNSSRTNMRCIEYEDFSSYLEKRKITITNNNNSLAMPEGTVVNLLLNTSGIKFTDNGWDVRIVYNDYVILDRINLTEFNSSLTRLYFKTQASIPAGSYDDNYYLYHDNPSASYPPENGNNVFIIADNFTNGVDSSIWNMGSCCSWDSSGFVSCSYCGIGVSKNQFVTMNAFGNMTVTIFRFYYTHNNSGYGLRHHLFSGSGACSEARYDNQNDRMGLLANDIYMKDVIIDNDIWYWGMAKRGGWNVDNLMYLNWNLEITNSTDLCKMDNGNIGWDVGEATDHAINIDDVYIYSYFYPEPNITVEQASLKMDFVSPTPSNGSIVQQTWVFINVSSDEYLDSCILEWNGTNESMMVIGSYCYINKTGLGNSNNIFRVYGRDVNFNTNVTEERYVTTILDNDPPDMVSLNVENNQKVSVNYLYINLTADEVLGNCTIEWDENNVSGNVDGVYCYRNMTGISDGNHSFIIYFEDLYANQNATEQYNITVDSSSPVIESITYETTIYETETNNITVVVNESNVDYVYIDLFVDGEANMTALGNNTYLYQYQKYVDNDWIAHFVVTVYDKFGHTIESEKQAFAVLAVSTNPEEEEEEGTTPTGGGSGGGGGVIVVTNETIKVTPKIVEVFARRGKKQDIQVINGYTFLIKNVGEHDIRIDVEALGNYSSLIYYDTSQDVLIKPGEEKGIVIQSNIPEDMPYGTYVVDIAIKDRITGMFTTATINLHVSEEKILLDFLKAIYSKLSFSVLISGSENAQNPNGFVIKVPQKEANIDIPIGWLILVSAFAVTYILMMRVMKERKKDKRLWIKKTYASIVALGVTIVVMLLI